MNHKDHKGPQRLVPALRWITALVLLLSSATTHAHKQSESYLSVTLQGYALHGQWDIALRDLEVAVGLDSNADERIVWGEVRALREEIERYAFRRLSLESVQDERRRRCEVRPGELLVDEHVDGAYAVLTFTAVCAQPVDVLEVHYAALFDVDPYHRSLLQVRAGDVTRGAVLSKATPTSSLALSTRDGWGELRSYVREGAWHIWHGYDHLLFLLTLLLPSVLIHRDRWEPASSFRDCAADIVKVVSAFTLAHSTTLAAGASGLVHLESRWVESAIAMTVLAGAANLLFPVVHARRWVVALIFGLVHGLGFASVLGDLDLAASQRAQALLGFNVGVELGQLAAVSIVMPIIWLMRGTQFYRSILLPSGASVIGALSIHWMITRMFAAP